MLLQNEIESTNNKYDDISKNFGMNNQEEPNQTETNEDVETTSDAEKEDDTGVKEEVTETDASKEEVKEENEKYNFGLANVSEVDNINAVVDFKVLAKLLGIGIALTLLSSLASMIAISRFSPLTILKERS